MVTAESLCLLARWLAGITTFLFTFYNHLLSERTSRRSRLDGKQTLYHERRADEQAGAAD
jgi:hypothetical protein